jgi:hypothetical protein
MGLRPGGIVSIDVFRRRRIVKIGHFLRARSVEAYAESKYRSGDSRNSLRVLQTNLCAPKGNSDTNVERSLLSAPCVMVVPGKLFATKWSFILTETTHHEEESEGFLVN